MQIPMHYFSDRTGVVHGRLLHTFCFYFLFLLIFFQNHRLDFNLYDEAWNGAASTIVEDEMVEVWGVLWTLNIDEMKNLDE